VEVGAYVFSNMALLAPALVRLLKKCTRDFFYGCVFADSIVGKKLARHIYRCHGWSMAERLRAVAESPAQEAFTYGFLAHLAADVVAHNFFVPNKIIASYKANALGHFYWEMRFERYLNGRVWKIMGDFAKSPIVEHDELMEKVLVSMLMPFRASKKIFERVVNAQSLGRWRRLVDRMSEKSPFMLDEEEFRKYLLLSADAAVDFLVRGEASWPAALDPLGVEVIRAAQYIRRGMRKLNRLQPVDDRFISSVFERLKPPAPAQGELKSPDWDKVFKYLGFE